jgi:hypothetical protein
MAPLNEARGQSLGGHTLQPNSHHLRKKIKW